VTAAITLGFKAFDAHELLCHFVAVQAGLYEREGIAVQLADITFVTDNELPEQLFRRCGAFQRGGATAEGLFVAVDQPMF
jgi:hypothetical protein